MKKKLIALAVAGVLSAPFAVFADEAAAPAAPAAAPAGPHTFTGNVMLTSEYLYRGIAQTRGKPAIQGGFDYSHSSGLYAGVWGSSITWISDAVAGASAGLEADIYGGYKNAFAEGSDWGYDVGVLTYNYPGTGKTNALYQIKPDTTELYGAISWKWLSLKYSHTTSALFGINKDSGLSDKTTGSGYLELNAAYDLGNTWGLSGHVGHQSVHGRSGASYSDVKVGVTKDLGFGTVGLAYSFTDAKDSCAASEFYCLANGSTGNTYSGGQGRALLTFGKTF